MASKQQELTAPEATPAPNARVASPRPSPLPHITSTPKQQLKSLNHAHTAAPTDPATHTHT